MLARVFRSTVPLRSRFTIKLESSSASDTEKPSYIIPQFSSTASIPSPFQFGEIIELEERRAVVPTDKNDNYGQFALGKRTTPVTIFKPTKNAMMNEKNDNWGWCIKDNTPDGFTAPLQGTDQISNACRVYPKSFKDVEDAVSYCNRNGLPYTVQYDPPRSFKKKAYSDCFRWKGLPKKEEF